MATGTTSVARRSDCAALELQLSFPGGEREEAPRFELCDKGGADARSWLRFDCPVRGGCLRLDPAGRDECIAVDPALDSIDWALTECDARLAEHLQSAGYAGDSRAVAAAWPGLRARFEAALRNPPMDLETLDREVLRARVTEKWNTYPKSITPAWVAEMDYPLAHPVRRVVKAALDGDDLGYALAPRETGVADAFAARMAERFDWTIDARRVVLLSEVVQAQYVALEAYSKPGDGVVVQPPIYPPFLSSVREMERTLIDNPLVQDGDGFRIDFEALAEDASAETRVVLLCNPHNPSGRVFTREELEALAKLAVERDWIVVSDEIHSDLIFGDRRHIPFGALGDAVAERTVTLTSATKSFNFPGLRCAVVHFGSAELQRRFESAVSRHQRGGMGLLGMYATVAAWRYGDPWLDVVRSKLDQNRRLVLRFVRERMPGVVAIDPESTYLAWLDFRALELEPSPARFFYERAQLALSDGRAFGEGYDGYARLNFSTSTAILEEILEAMAGALDAR